MNVTVYTKLNCPKCEYLKEYLSEIGVEYDVRPIENQSNLEDMIARGNNTVPVLRMIQNTGVFTEYTKGFSKNSVKEIMRKHGVEINEQK